MGSRERRERQLVDTRRRIVEAARKMFVQKGYEATTMRAIAERIEYTPPAIYHHFRNKRALLTELCWIDFRALARAFTRIGDVRDPIERLKRIGEAYVDFGIKRPMQYQLMMLTRRPDVVISPGVGEPPADPNEDAYAFVLQACSDAIASGRLRSEYTDHHELAVIVWAGWHGLVSLEIIHGDDSFMKGRDLRRAADHLHDAIMGGLLKRGTT